MRKTNTLNTDNQFDMIIHVLHTVRQGVKQNSHAIDYLPHIAVLHYFYDDCGINALPHAYKPYSVFPTYQFRNAVLQP